MNWGELKSLARVYVHRSDLDFDALCPLACSNVSTSLIVQENESSSSVTLSGPDSNGLWSSALPVQYALARSVVQSGRTLNPVDIKMLIERGGARYAISGMQLFTVSAGDCTLVYSERLAPFTDDAETNAVLDHYPDVVLYALLKHAAAVIQDPEISSEFYDVQFRGAVATANSLYIDAAFGPGTIATPMGGMV